MDGQHAKVMFEKANSFLDTLFPPQRNLTAGDEHALLPLDHPNRCVMHYLVPSAQRRSGLKRGSMNKNQEDAATELLQVSLSEAGFKKVEQIRLLEYVLADAKKADPGAFQHDAGDYYFTVFGLPVNGRLPANVPWSWRYEGHHISLHWTVLGDRIVASTPQFLGAQPSTVEVEVEGGPHKGTRVLGREDDLAVELIRDLATDKERRRKAMFSVPWDIETGVARDALHDRHPPLLENRGILYSDLTGGQQEKLKELVAEYASTQLQVVAEERLARIEQDGWERVQLFWMGGLESDDPHYYRIKGSTFVIEYDNTAFNQPDHQHTVWRDFRSDWGRDALSSDAYGPDLIRHHYETADHHELDRVRRAFSRNEHQVVRNHSRGWSRTKWELSELNNLPFWVPYCAIRSAHTLHVHR